jgi:hypothetical protein
MTKAAIACLAGRRIDPIDADVPRFPLYRASGVGVAIAAVLVERKISRLVCAAACGADILALEACEALAIPATIVLPFSVTVFREASVIDRPGDWGPRFDQVIARARAHSDLVELGYTKNDQRAFLEANHEIVARVTAANAGEKFAIVVWDGAKRAEDDATADLADEARKVGFEVIEVLTVEHIR